MTGCALERPVANCPIPLIPFPSYQLGVSYRPGAVKGAPTARTDLESLEGRGRGFRSPATGLPTQNPEEPEFLSRFAELSRSGGGVHAVKFALCAALLAASAGAQSSTDWTIDTFAGSGASGDGGDGGPATDAQLYIPSDVAVDGAGNLYIADTYNHRIRKVDSSGVITTFAGTGESGFRGGRRPGERSHAVLPLRHGERRRGQHLTSPILSTTGFES